MEQTGGQESISVLAELRPAVIASGHGPVIAGADLAERLRTLASQAVEGMPDNAENSTMPPRSGGR